MSSILAGGARKAPCQTDLQGLARCFSLWRRRFGRLLANQQGGGKDALFRVGVKGYLLGSLLWGDIEAGSQLAVVQRFVKCFSSD